MKATTGLSQLTKYVATGVAIAMLTACGGGGGSSSSANDDINNSVADTNSSVVESNETIVEGNNTIVVAPNHAPVITSPATASVEENQNVAITVVATDADSDTITYSIEGGADKDKVAINPSTGAVVFIQAPDFETKSSYSFQVGASDGIDTTTQDVTISITDVYEGNAPIITTLENISVNENQKGAFIITATDVDGDTLTYSLEGGADVSSFDVNSSTGVVTFKTEPDYETKDKYYVTVGASDGHDTTTKDITVSILDLQGGSTIPQTGQTVRYVNHDDGDYLAGIERSFNRVNSIVLKDEATGLYWKDNISIKIAKYDDAQDYCRALDNVNGTGFGGYKGWRLPTVEELSAIVDRGTSDNAIFNEFENTKGDKYYWTKTERMDDIHYTVDFKTGKTGISGDNTNLYVRCVSDNPSSLSKLHPVTSPILVGLYHRFTRANDVISDNETKLQWYDPTIFTLVGGSSPMTGHFELVGLPASTGTFEEAIQGCEDLVADGKNDWRLANINELISIVDYSLEDGDAFYSEFKSVAEGSYFSSTTSDTNSNNAWTIAYDGTGWGGIAIGLVDNTNAKTTTNNYRCVRTMGD